MFDWEQINPSESFAVGTKFVNKADNQRYEIIGIDGLIPETRSFGVSYIIRRERDGVILRLTPKTLSYCNLTIIGQGE